METGDVGVRVRGLRVTGPKELARFKSSVALPGHELRLLCLGRCEVGVHLMGGRRLEGRS